MASEKKGVVDLQPDEISLTPCTGWGKRYLALCLVVGQGPQTAIVGSWRGSSLKNTRAGVQLQTTRFSTRDSSVSLLARCFSHRLHAQPGRTASVPAGARCSRDWQYGVPA